jgi:hypothetical protein
MLQCPASLTTFRYGDRADGESLGLTRFVRDA